MAASGRSDPASGREAEAFVAARLAEDGWEILDRNWYGGRGELDLVARRAARVRFVEVKARLPGDDSGWEAAEGVKHARLVGAAEAWMLAHPAAGDEYAFLLAVVSFDPAGWTVTLLDDPFDGGAD